MWNYFLVFISVVLLAANFMVTKLYQKRRPSNLKSSLEFGIIGAPVTFLLIFALNGFTMTVSPFSVVNCILKSLCAAYGILGFEIMRRGNVAIYTLFLMSGGMLVPAVYGWLFLGEPATPLRVLGVAVIVFSVILSNASKEKPNKILLLLCVAVFFMNGGVSVFSKLHQINTTDNPVSTTDYMLIGILTSFLLNSFLRLGIFVKERLSKQEKNDIAQVPRGKSKPSALFPIFLILLSAVVSNASYFLQLEGARGLPASVLYPMITGGSVVLSGIFAFLFFKERLNKREWISLIICFIGTCLFL